MACSGSPLFGADTRLPSHGLPQAALRLGPLEVGVLLGSVGRSAADLQSEAAPPEEEQAPRTWLKGVREAGYTVLGTAAARVPGFYEDLQRAAAVGAALTADLAAMEMRHLRLMVKTAVSIHRGERCKRAGRMQERKGQDAVPRAFAKLV